MLEGFPIIPTLPVADAERARRWYAEALGLEPSASVPGGGDLYPAGGRPMGFLLYPSAFAGTSGATAASWDVDDLPTVMAGLRARGVVFEDYDLPGLTTADGVATLPNGSRAAWFRDSEGNILALSEMPPA